MAELREHWDAVYSTTAPAETSWHAEEHEPSLTLLAPAFDASEHPRMLDIGGGRSGLASALCDRGAHVDVLDISQSALTQAVAADPRIDTIVADVRSWVPPHRYDAVHDRAVLHFLVEQSDRDRYAATVTSATAPGGLLVIGTFAPDGPEQCSGLPVHRSSAAELVDLMGPAWHERERRQHMHITPWGAEQSFTWVALERLDD